jgi:hypothetical protein
LHERAFAGDAVTDTIEPEVRELLDSLFRIVETLYLEQSAYIALLNEHAPQSLPELAYLVRNPQHQRAVREKFQPLFDRSLSIPKLKETVERLVCTPMKNPPKPN